MNSVKFTQQIFVFTALIVSLRGTFETLNFAKFGLSNGQCPLKVRQAAKKFSSSSNLELQVNIFQPERIHKLAKSLETNGERLSSYAQTGHLLKSDSPPEN